MARPLKTTSLVCFDVETTGLDLDMARLVEVAVVRFTLEQNQTSFESLIDPGCPIPVDSSAIHRITDEMVQGKPRIEQLLPELIKMLEGQILVGHGIGFDIEMIQRAADRARIPCQLRTNPTIDTLRLARLYGQSPDNALETLRRHFGVLERQAHRAMGDVEVNIDVFRHLVRRYQTVEQVMDALSRPIEMRIMPLGKHKGRPMREIPVDYLRWAVKQDFDIDLRTSLQRELQRRSQGGLFSQATNPFSDFFSE
jgi:DNA polymerase III subunit epsilon